MANSWSKPKTKMQNGCVTNSKQTKQPFLEGPWADWGERIYPPLGADISALGRTYWPPRGGYIRAPPLHPTRGVAGISAHVLSRLMLCQHDPDTMCQAFGSKLANTCCAGSTNLIPKSEMGGAASHTSALASTKLTVMSEGSTTVAVPSQ